MKGKFFIVLELDDKNHTGKICSPSPPLPSSLSPLSLLTMLSVALLCIAFICDQSSTSSFGALGFSSPTPSTPSRQLSRSVLNDASARLSSVSTRPRRQISPKVRTALFSSTRDPQADARPPITNSEVDIKSTRQVESIEQFARLPIWPIWSGILLFLTSRLSPSLAASIEDAIGGRVCPNFFNAQQTSPFVLMVHHRHSFSALDPIRFIQQFVFPEGFPSHPHRGFVTVTYCLKGGMIHRDSLGIKQSYGAEKHHNGAHVQWLTAGAGIQHEEMWDTSDNALWSDQELFQIWLNLPSYHKMDKPKVELLRRCEIEKGSSIPEDSTPVVKEDGTITTVVCGEYNGMRATIACPTNAAIIRVQFTKKTAWRHVIPREHETAIMYIRQGSVRVGGETIKVHHTAYLSAQGEDLVIESDANADVLLMSGEPLREP